MNLLFGISFCSSFSSRISTRHSCLRIPKPVPLYFFLLGHRPRYVNLPSFRIDNDVVWMRDRIPADDAERRSSFKLVFPFRFVFNSGFEGVVTLLIFECRFVGFHS